jgi:hypothetical protein
MTEYDQPTEPLAPPGKQAWRMPPLLLLGGILLLIVLMLTLIIEAISVDSKSTRVQTLNTSLGAGP